MTTCYHTLSFAKHVIRLAVICCLDLKCGNVAQANKWSSTQPQPVSQPQEPLPASLPPYLQRGYTTRPSLRKASFNSAALQQLQQQPQPASSTLSRHSMQAQLGALNRFSMQPQRSSLSRASMHSPMRGSTAAGATSAADRSVPAAVSTSPADSGRSWRQLRSSLALLRQAAPVTSSVFTQRQAGFQQPAESASSG